MNRLEIRSILDLIETNGKMRFHLRLIQQKDSGNIFTFFEWIIDNDEFTGQHVEQHRLIVVRVGSRPLVVWTQNQLLHDSFDAWIYVPLQIGR